MKHQFFTKAGNYLFIGFVLAALFFSISSCSKDDDDSKPLDLAGKWRGTFTGDVSGTWEATISESGIVTGTAMVTSPPIQSHLNGNVSSDGKFTATVGTTSLGYNFDGQLNGKSGSGTWKNSSKTQSGIWSGKKE
jgi:hypothetical protein